MLISTLEVLWHAEVKCTVSGTRCLVLMPFSTVYFSDSISSHKKRNTRKILKSKAVYDYRMC